MYAAKLSTFLELVIGLVLGSSSALIALTILYSLKSRCMEPDPDSSYQSALFDVVNWFATGVPPERSSRRMEVVSAVIAQSYGTKKDSSSNTTQTENDQDDHDENDDQDPD